MDADSGGLTAADVVNNLTITELKELIETVCHAFFLIFLVYNIFHQYGEDTAAERLAIAIVKEREKKGPFKTTDSLANVIRRAMPNPETFKKDPATRTFQALRIFVNNEVPFFNSVCHL